MLAATMQAPGARSRVGPGQAVRIATALAVALLVLALPAASLAADPTPPASTAAPTPVPAATPLTIDGSQVVWQDRAADGSARVHLYFGWTSTCPHCAKARPFIASLQQRWPWLVVHSYQLDGDANAPNVQFIADLATAVGGSLQGVPIFVFDGRMTSGFDEADTTGAELAAAFQAVHDRGAGTAPEPSPGADTVEVPLVGSVAVGSLSLPLVTVVLAGLDSVNPCALAVLLFLLGLLVGSRSRKRMALIGGAFVLVSGLSYFVFMSAWLNVFLLTGGLRIVTLLAGVAAMIAALINIKDFAWFRRGPSLVIPESAKPRIFGRMIDFTDRTGFLALFGGTVLVAIAANLYEALCTGGFPVVFTRILTLHGLSTAEYYLWLALYAVVYVLPLLAIVIVFSLTLGSHTVTITEARRLKLLSGLLMLCLGILLVAAPERLNDLGTSVLVFGTAVAIWLAAVFVDRQRSHALVPAPTAAPPHVPGAHGNGRAHAAGPTPAPTTGHAPSGPTPTPTTPTTAHPTTPAPAARPAGRHRHAHGTRGSRCR